LARQAASLVAKSKAGSTIAATTGGLTVVMVIRVPLGSRIGQLFGWRMPFLIVTVMETAAILGLTWLPAREISYELAASIVAQLSLLGNRRLATMYLLTAIRFGSTLPIFTFLSPSLTGVTGVRKEAVNIALLLFGGATIVGHLAGRMLTDVLGTRRAMMILLCGLIVSFVSIRLSIHNELATFAVISVGGLFAFPIQPVMQAGVVTTAKQEAPDALATASGFNIAGFNLGTSSGSFIGGQLLKGPVC
jgi:MFS transporter, DHA1 family, inner membrane transport protein